jgi:hypothetical protein
MDEWPNNITSKRNGTKEETKHYTENYIYKDWQQEPH